MALMHLNYSSRYLAGNTDVNVILPDLPSAQKPEAFYASGKKYPVLWLLHGTYGDYTDWVRKTNIELYAAEKELIVVMPSALNSDYANWPDFALGYDGYSFLTEELMPLVYGWLPASTQRENNFIAGLSMGGRGACEYVFHHPEKFAAAYIMSACPQDMRKARPDSTWADRNRNRLKNTGGLDGWLRSPQNLWDMVPALAAQKERLPKLYFACGTNDSLIYQDFLAFREHAEQYGFPAEFIETEGYSHEWRFWELCIRDAVERFLPAPAASGDAF